jgi:hypothetical protein
MRKAIVAALAAAGVVASLGMTGGHERSSLSAGMNFKRLSATEGWGRVWAVGGTIYGFRIRGVDFDVTDVKSARASGGAAPACTVSGSPAILDCRGTFPDGSSIFVDFGISGTGNSFQEENFFNASPGVPQFFITNTLGPAFLPVDATLVAGSGTTKTVTVKGQNAFDDIEVMPYGFKIGSVTKTTPSGKCDPEGPGIDCSINLPAGQTATITFDTAPAARTLRASDQNSADVLAHGHDGTADKFVVEQKNTAKYDLFIRWLGATSFTYWVTPESPNFGRIAIGKIEWGNTAAATRDSPPTTMELNTAGPSAGWRTATLTIDAGACGVACDWPKPVPPGVSRKWPVDFDLGRVQRTALVSKERPVGFVKLKPLIAYPCDQANEVDCTNNLSQKEVTVTVHFVRNLKSLLYCKPRTKPTPTKPCRRRK